MKRPVRKKFVNHIFQQTKEICEYRKNKLLWCVKFEADLDSSKNLRVKLTAGCFCITLFTWDVEKYFNLFNNEELPSFFNQESSY